MTHRRATSRPAGVLLLEVMFGLALTATLISILAVSIGTYRHGLRQLADRRAAIHLAERVLTEMEQGGPASTPPPADPRIKIRLVPPSDGAAPRGRQWVQVSVAYAGGDATLTGLIPSPAPPATEARP